jgi:hypothetical protein
MSIFINQMLGCLLIAAGIGGAVGWLLRHVSAGKDAQLLADVTAMMRIKEQMLEKARYELRETTAKLQAIESPVTAPQEAEQHLLQLKMQAKDNESLEKAA